MKECKSSWRRSIKELLRKKPVSEIVDESTNVCHKVFELISGLKAKQLKERPSEQPLLVSVYLSMPQEVQTESLLVSLLKTNEINVCFPKIQSSQRSSMVMLPLSSFEEIKDEQKFKLDKWGIPEAIDNRQPVCPSKMNVIVVPGVAFDRDRNRLGHGKGYYDSFISSVNNKRSAMNLSSVITIGVCFENQVIDSVPVDEHDVKMDYVVTGSNIYNS